MSLEEVLTLTPMEHIRGHFGRTDTQVKQDLLILREWIRKQAHLPQSASDHFLEIMLIHKKFSLEKVKKKLEMYYTVRTLFPYIFQNRAPSAPHMQALMNCYLLVPLPVSLSVHSRITVISFIPVEQSVFDIRDCLKYMFTYGDLRVNFDRYLDEYCLIDMRYATIEHVRSCTPTNVRNSVFVFEQAFSPRVKGVHVINGSPLTNSVITFFKSALKKKISDRVHIHKDVESLYNIFPKDGLPSDYGGNLGSLQDINSKWKKFILSKEEWIVENGNMKTNENMRVGEPVDLDTFGLSGSFRQLQID